MPFKRPILLGFERRTNYARIDFILRDGSIYVNNASQLTKSKPFVGVITV